MTADRSITELIRVNHRRRIPEAAVWVGGYSDASVSQARDRAGIAWWVRGPTLRVVSHEPAPPWVKDVGLAELAGVCRAIKEAFIIHGVTPLDAISVRTDNQQVARAMGWRKGKRWVYKSYGLDWDREIRQAFHRAEILGILLRVSWTKGHAGGQTTQSYLNERVDKLARLARYGQRGRLVGAAMPT